jgi:hypothetical protein
VSGVEQLAALELLDLTLLAGRKIKEHRHMQFVAAEQAMNASTLSIPLQGHAVQRRSSPIRLRAESSADMA